MALGTWDISQGSRVTKLVGCAPGNVASAVTHADNTDKNRLAAFLFRPLERRIYTFDLISDEYTILIFVFDQIQMQFTLAKLSFMQFPHCNAYF